MAALVTENDSINAVANKSIDYQALNNELEQILDKLQSGELSIDEAMPAYERGLKLVEELEAYLKTAQNRVTELQAKLKD